MTQCCASSWTPLMVAIVVMAYKDRSPSKMRAAELAEERRQRLFDDYIAAMFRRKGKQSRYAQLQTLAWLGWLAHGMTRQAQTVLLIERLQPAWLTLRAERHEYMLLDRSITGLAFGLVFGVVYGLAFG